MVIIGPRRPLEGRCRPSCKMGIVIGQSHTAPQTATQGRTGPAGSFLPSNRKNSKPKRAENTWNFI